MRERFKREFDLPSLFHHLSQRYDMRGSYTGVGGITTTGIISSFSLVKELIQEEFQREDSIHVGIIGNETE